jgi:hypothetical protein
VNNVWHSPKSAGKYDVKTEIVDADADSTKCAEINLDSTLSPLVTTG